MYTFWEARSSEIVSAVESQHGVGWKMKRAGNSCLWSMIHLFVQRQFIQIVMFFLEGKQKMLVSMLCLIKDPHLCSICPDGIS